MSDLDQELESLVAKLDAELAGLDERERELRNATSALVADIRRALRARRALNGKPARGNRKDRRNRSAAETRQRRAAVEAAIAELDGREFVAAEIAEATRLNVQGVAMILASLARDGAVEVRDEPERKLYSRVRA